MFVSLSARLWVRSRALEGLLLLLADSKMMDLVVVRLAAGKVWLSADLGRGPASVTSSVAINDGQWHHVSVRQLSAGRPRASFYSVTDVFILTCSNGSYRL